MRGLEEDGKEGKGRKQTPYPSVNVSIQAPGRVEVSCLSWLFQCCLWTPSTELPLGQACCSTTQYELAALLNPHDSGRKTLSPYKESHSRAGDSAQWVKCLLQKRRTSVQIPRSHAQPRMEMCVSNRSSGDCWPVSLGSDSQPS